MAVLEQDLMMEVATLAFQYVETQRMGQAYFNALNYLRPDLGLEIINTELDPYIDDANLPQFFAFIEGRIKGEEQ